MAIITNPKRIPPPTPAFPAQASIHAQPDAKCMIQGDVTADWSDYPVHLCRHAGRIRNVSLSAVKSGQDDDNTLSLEVDILINGVSCLDTSPKFTYVSGEASTYINTMQSGEQIIQAVIDPDNCSYNPGDIISCDGDITRTASPDDEIGGVCVLVEFEPNLPK